MGVLDKHVLTLNRNWFVIGTTTVKGAIILMSRFSAKGVCPETFQTYDWDTWISPENPAKVDDYVKTASIAVPAPQAIILSNYKDIHQTSVKFSQRAIYKRDNYTCQYCRRKFKSDELSIDHVIPRSKNGPNSFENCVTACFRCNNRKGDLSIEEAGMKLVKKPIRPDWNPIFNIRDEECLESWKPLLHRSLIRE